MNASAPRWRRRAIPLLIGIVVLIPLALAALLYVQPAWFTFGHSNHGRLIRPPVRINVTALPQAFTASKLPADYFRGHWTLVYVGGAHCGADCREALYVTRQIRLGTGNDIRRVQRLYVVRAERGDATGFLRGAHPDLAVVEATGAAGRRLATQFTDTDVNADAGANIYIVDPRGLLMMSYPVKAKPLGLLQDLRHLLTANPA
ncbi:MAG: SCO family protein [Gammaproteobacteria bacterium]